MAKVSNPLIGATSGSIGGVTFSKWKGINVAKTKPTSVANPQSDKQIAQRSAMTQIIALFRMFSSIISLGFIQQAIGKSAYNAFVSYNVKNAFDLSSPPAATLMKGNLKFAKGTIAPTVLLTFVPDEDAHNAAVTYPTTTAGAGQSATDKLVVVMYNATKDEWSGFTTALLRSDGSGSVAIPANWLELDLIGIYSFFVNADGTACSDSVLSD